MLTDLVAHCLGEISGYALGAGDAAWQRVPFEFLTASEKKAASR
jgi:hypothetical protein